jgi:membrane protein YdbS with pleckstrin-like domain
MEKESGGIGFVGVLQITFVVLKLCKVIDWSWWWVLSPIWISTALTILVVLIGIIVIYVRDKRWRRYQ